MVDDMINISKTWLNRFKPDNAETKDKNPQFHKIVGATSFTNCINLTDKENIVIRYPLFFITDQLHFKIFCRRRRLKEYPLQVRYKQDWGRGFILLLPQTAALPGSDAGSGVIKPASGFVIQNRQTSCSMWCPMYKARC